MPGREKPLAAWSGPDQLLSERKSDWPPGLGVGSGAGPGRGRKPRTPLPREGRAGPARHGPVPRSLGELSPHTAPMATSASSR